MLCTNVREIPLAIWSYYLLLSVYRMIVFSKYLIKFTWDLNFICFKYKFTPCKIIGLILLLVQISTLKMLYFCALRVLLLLPLFRSLMYGIILKKLKILFCVQSVREFTCLIVYIKNCFTCSHVSDFWWVLLPSEIFIDFGLPLRPRETDWRSGPGC